MATRTTIHHDTKPSALAKFNLGFEYNQTWDDARKSTQKRAL